MVDTLPAQLNRKLLGEFLKNPETIKAFENLSINSADLAEVISGIQSAAVLVLSLSDLFENERVIATDGEVQLTDGGPGGNLTFGLSDTGVTAATYGSASQTVQFAVNAKGRITLAQSHALASDNVTEGVTNLYFTNTRARSALSGGAGISYNSATGVIAAGTVLSAYAGGDAPSPFTLSIVDSADAAAWRAAIDLGTAATQNIGTSGTTVPLLDGANTWSAGQTISGQTGGANLALSRRGAGLEGAQITFGYGNAIAGDWITDVDAANNFRILKSDGGGTIVAASFSPSTGAITLASALAASSGGTGQSSYTIGDLLYASSASALSKLADVATGNALISGGAGVAPSWGKIGISTHVDGLGTNVATFLGTPSSTNLAAAVADETGSGALVFGTGPSLATPVLSAVPSSAWGADFASASTLVSIANNGTYDLATGSGMVALYEDGGAGAGLFMTWYGSVTIVSQNAAAFTTTSGTAGKINVFYNGGTSKYRIENKTGGAINFYVTTIRCRPSA